MMEAIKSLVARFLQTLSQGDIFIRDGKIFRITEYLDTLRLENALVPFLPG